ncbi:hypothetical protein D3C76_1500310 [compost metagenome]
MCFANRCKHIYDLARQVESISLAGVNYHIYTAKRMNRTLERSFPLYTYDLLLRFVQVTGSMGCDRGRLVDFNVKYASGFSFFLGQIGNNVP